MPETLTGDPPAAPVRALSDKQERSFAHANARINLWTGSIRSGKTIASLLRWCNYVATAPTGGALIVTGKTYDTVSRNVFGPLMDPGITGPIAAQIRYTRGASTAMMLGRQIEVITANDVKAEGRLRGVTCAGAYGDEVTLLPEGFFDQLLGRMSVPGAKFFGTSNPDNPTHWLRQRFILRSRELGGRHFRHWHFTLDDNPGLDATYVNSIKKEYVGLWYKRFILGEWVLAEGAVFDMWDEDQHVVDKLPPIVRWISLGIDYATASPTAALLLGVGEDGRLYLTREWRHDPKHARRQLTDVDLSTQIRAWLEGLKVWPEWMVVDPSAASLRLQLHRDGITTAAADNSVLDGLRMMGSLLALGLLRVHCSCKGLINEIPGYSWDDERAAKGEDAPIKADDHSIDAARYAIKTPEVLWRPLVRSAYSLAA